MRFEQLEFFVETAKSQSMRGAAEKLHASPQNVSKAVKQLEEELDFPLFIRSRQGLFLTPLGPGSLQSRTDDFGTGQLSHAAFGQRRTGRS